MVNRPALCDHRWLAIRAVRRILEAVSERQLTRLCAKREKGIAMSSETQLKGKLGYREYVCFPADGRRHEVIDGEHIVNPAPDTYHQTLSRKIQFQLYTQIELRGLGMVFDAPTDLQLSDLDIVQPDLIVVLQHKRTIVTPAKIKGVPDLIVEILSASSLHTDRVLKKELYRKSAVPEYWIVDPDDHVVEQYVLRGEAYLLLDRATERITAQSAENVSVNLSEVW
jgi:Uma2 family endonuclease